MIGLLARLACAASPALVAWLAVAIIAGVGAGIHGLMERVNGNG